MLGARLLQHRQPLARPDDQRAQIHRQLHVEVLRLDLVHRRPDPDPGVVHQHVEPPVGLAVGVEEADDLLLARHVRGDALDLGARRPDLLDGRLELLRPPRRDRQRIAVLAQGLRDRQPDAARCPRDQCRALGQAVTPLARRQVRADPIRLPDAGPAAAGLPSLRSPDALPQSRHLLPACLPPASLAGGCGDDGNGGSEPGDIASRPAPPPSDFPSAEGKTLGDVIDEASGPASLVVSPASMVFYKGENRYSFGVFEKDRTQVPDAEVALYFARVPPGEPPPVIPPAVPPGASGDGRTAEPHGRPRRRRRDRLRGPGRAPGARPAGDRPVHRGRRQPRDRSRLPRPDHLKRPRRGARRLHRRDRLPGRRRVAHRRPDQGGRQADRDPPAQRQRRPVHTGAARSATPRRESTLRRRPRSVAT